MSAYNLPDKLVVKCTFDNKSKKITFHSARNCSYDVLKGKIEQCFPLHARSYAIAYKDDDGEITDISTDEDLTDAIQFFQSGSDDLPGSSNGSAYSGRSSTSRRVTLRVHIRLEYDGPALSDTASLASVDEYRDRNGSQLSFSLSSSPRPYEEDAATVSSRDYGGRIPRAPLVDEGYSSPESAPPSHADAASLDGQIRPGGEQASNPFSDGFSEDYVASAERRYPDYTSTFSLSQFEHLSLQDEGADNLSIPEFEPLSTNERGAAWLREQNERVLLASGNLPEPTESDAHSTRGGLSLERNSSGRVYFAYNSTSGSQVHGSSLEEGTSSRPQSGQIFETPRPSSMQLNWIADQQRSYPSSSNLDLKGWAIPEDTEQAAAPFLGSGPRADTITDCSVCGTALVQFRYVCSTCREKTPGQSPELSASQLHASHLYPPSAFSGSSSTLVGSTAGVRPHLTLSPTIPSQPPPAFAGGYELCPNCIEEKGVMHAIAASGSVDGNVSPSSPEHHQWRLRQAPQRGRHRHAFTEKYWNSTRWESVEQDDTKVSTCSFCSATTNSKRYKCFSCPNIHTCRACYSRVHELHPHHTFLIVPDRSASEQLQFQSPPPDPSNEQSLLHPDTLCTHCMLPIVGARFHCVVCPSVDICQACESAGMPGNLDSTEDGHKSNHYLLKIPHPVPVSELRTLSQRAYEASLGLFTSREFPSHEVSYARTVVGFNMRSSDDHRVPCNACNKRITGIRYQCASCPSMPGSIYNLCESCEETSYLVHDAMHVFFKIPRPVLRPLETPQPLVPPLYLVPAGQSRTSGSSNDPKAYLDSVRHENAFCDLCMTEIKGEWFRCGYCIRDLCDSCQEVDTHDDTHIFLVLKSTVDMAIFKNVLHNRTIIPYPVYSS
ncbi:hypothetical protein BDN72DRAFT_955324 [Pluteus cervinus]|uniref:Uncharacterized protein n=1 Tax=Pluteus cervinus TaxID=181527 RepID=A0ACD3BAX2_9AGAR|nr:hypothetical protein BDN72DRAFT_955324 [Pluteus cervinus]